MVKLKKIYKIGIPNGNKSKDSDLETNRQEPEVCLYMSYTKRYRPEKTRYITKTLKKYNFLIK